MNVRTTTGRPPQEPDSQALDWFVRRRRGLDAAEQAGFRAWLTADPAHAAALARWEREWSGLDGLPAESIRALRRGLEHEKAAQAATADAAATTASVSAAAPNATAATVAAAAVTATPTAAAGPQAGQPDARRTTRACGAPDRPALSSRRGFWLGPPGTALAAAALLAVCGGWLGWRHWDQPVYVQRYATERGQQLDARLPDGSLLRLDTASRAEVAFFRGRREVRLPEGQAYFEVAADARHPFEVLAGPVRVTVVGTRFSVRYTPGIPGRDGAQVAVEQGRVKVARAHGLLPQWLAGDGAEVVLGPGQQVSGEEDGGIGPAMPVAAAGVAPWLESRVSFDDTPLAAALAEFERYGPTGLAVRDPAVATLRLTGTFNPRRVDNFARILPQVLPVRLQAQGDTTEIAASR